MAQKVDDMFEFFKGMRKGHRDDSSYKEDGTPVNGRGLGSYGWGFYALVLGVLWALIVLVRSVMYFFG